MTKRLELQCISGVSSKKMSAQNLILTRLGLNPDVQKCIYVPFGQVAQHAPFGVTGSAHGGWGHGIGWQKCLSPCLHGCGQLFVVTTGIMVVTSETNKYYIYYIYKGFLKKTGVPGKNHRPVARH